MRDLALGQARGRGHHRLRALGDVGIAFGQGRRGIGWPMRGLQQREQTAFAVGESFELLQLRAVEWQLRELLRGLPKIEPQARVVVDQLRIFENQMLTHQALERCRLFVELSAGVAGLRRLQYRLLALRSQAIETDDQLDQRVEQGQADQQEAEQDELEE